MTDNKFYKINKNYLQCNSVMLQYISKGVLEMDDELISKKELLELTGISYGQLYRWKRKNLIPEGWFIRKSTFTGQETFFPKKKILERIDKIKNMKEGLSLDDLANMFSPDAAEISLSIESLKEQNIVSSISIDLYTKQYGETKDFTFEDILFIYIIDKLLSTGEINIDEGKMVLKTLKDFYKNFKDRKCDLIFLRKFGISSCLLTLDSNEIYFESGTKIVNKLSIASLIEELKIKLINGGINNER